MRNFIPITPLVERPIERSDSSSAVNRNDIPFVETNNNSSSEFISAADTTSSPGFNVIAIKPPVRGESYSTSGVIGMKFRANDNLLTMARVNAVQSKDSFVFTATDGGYGKKTPIDEYRLQGRGGIGIKAAKIDENSRGSLVSALVLRDEDEILAITSAGTVMRTPAAEVRQTGRDSMGVRLVNLDETNNNSSSELINDEETTSSPGFKVIAISPPVRGESYSLNGVFFTKPLRVARTKKGEIV